MKDLYNAINALDKIINENTEIINEQDRPGKPNPVAYKSFADMISAIKLPGRQGVADPDQSRANIQKAQAAQAKPAAKKAATKKPAAFTGRPDDAPKPSAAAIDKTNAAPRPFADVRRTQTAMPGTTVAKRAKVKATAANTKDFDKTMALQKSLIAKGADIKADGIMGPNTRAAMAKFMPKPAAAPTTIPKSRPLRTGAAKTKGPDPMGLANPSPEVRAQAKQNAADRRAARQKKSREFFRNLGNTLFPKANF